MTTMALRCILVSLLLWRMVFLLDRCQRHPRRRLLVTRAFSTTRRNRMTASARFTRRRHNTVITTHSSLRWDATAHCSPALVVPSSPRWARLHELVRRNTPKRSLTKDMVVSQMLRGNMRVNIPILVRRSALSAARLTCLLTLAQARSTPIRRTSLLK